MNPNRMHDLAAPRDGSPIYLDVQRKAFASMAERVGCVLRWNMDLEECDSNVCQ